MCLITRIQVWVVVGNSIDRKGETQNCGWQCFWSTGFKFELLLAFLPITVSNSSAHNIVRIQGMGWKQSLAQDLCGGVIIALKGKPCNNDKKSFCFNQRLISGTWTLVVGIILLAFSISPCTCLRQVLPAWLLCHLGVLWILSVLLLALVASEDSLLFVIALQNSLVASPPLILCWRKCLFVTY